MIHAADITPLSESEEIHHYPQLAFTVPGDYCKWICFCGETCIITGKQIAGGTLGGLCRCSRAYILNRIAGTVRRVAM